MQPDRLNVLVVEDIPVYLSLLQRILTTCGIACTTANNLEKAIAIAKGAAFDAVLLDLGLPDSFGLETFTRFNNSCGDLPVVVLTGIDDEEMALAIVKQGAQDYLLKGAYLTQEESGKQLLVRAIRNAIERKQAQEALRRERDMLEVRVQDRTDELIKSNQKLTEELGKRTRAEAALRDSETRNQALLNAIPDIIGRIDHQGTIIDWKMPAESLLKLIPNKTLIGLPIEVFLPGFTPAGYDYLQQAMQTGEIQVFEQEIDTNGISRSMEVRMATSGDGEVLLMLRDITEQKIADEQARLSQERLRQLTSRLVSAQEDERRRISLELHDDAGQTLTTLNLSLALIQRELPPEYRSLHEYVRNVIRLSEMAMTRIRALSHQLRPPSLDAVGLNQTLNDHCQKIGKQSGLDIDYSGIDIPELPNHIQINLYRVLQEALTNVIKHASASYVWVTLTYEKNLITLQITDDGKGFNPQTQPRDLEGIGLLGMGERVESLGGKLEVRSEVEHGATLVARIPWKAAQGAAQ